MAKAATKSATPSVAAPAFQVRFGSAPAPIERKVGGETSPYAAVMKTMPAPQDGKYANFFVPAAEPAATITDADERTKATRDNARKLSNALSGLSRRIAKKDPSKAFALRTTEEGGKIGVCVYRVEVTPAPAAPASA